MLSTVSKLLAIGAYLVSANVDCDDYFECQAEEVGNDRLNCYGYGSCSEVVIETEHGIRCDGDRACYKGQLVADESISCRSVASCEEATLQTDDDVYCEGVNGCANAKINGNGKVYSYGHYATVGATITGAQTVRGYGYYSLLFATIDSGEDNEMSLKIYGVDSGYGANVICQSGSTCSIQCKSAGCLNLDFICLNGASCSVSPDACVEDNSVSDYEGVTCPTWKVSTSDDDDAEFYSYMEEKEVNKESDKKWTLYQEYIEDDLTLFESRESEESEMHKNKIVAKSGNSAFINNVASNYYELVPFALLPFVLLGMCVYRNRSNDNYQKV